MPKTLAWGITGSGHHLLESFMAMKQIKKSRDVRIDAYLSAAGEETVKMYGLWGDLEAISNRIFHDVGASAPESGRLSIGHYSALVVSPATANTVAKVVTGVADTLVTNAVAQAQKGGTSLFFVPTDLEVGTVISTLPHRIDGVLCRVHISSPSWRGCGAQEACIYGAIEVGESARIDLLKCTGCGSCVTACPYEAIEFGERVEVQIREVDAENVRRLKAMKGVAVLKHPGEIAEAITPVMESETAPNLPWMRIDADETADDIMRAAQLAAALEVSGWPKPGNVHRTADFEDTRFEQFLAGSIALGFAVREAAMWGIKAGLGQIEVSDIGLGRHIRRGVEEVRGWHRGGNTHLGASLLFVPLAAAAGLTLASEGEMDSTLLRENARRIMESTSPQDAVEAYRAIKEAGSAGLGRVVGLDVPDLADENCEEAILGGEFNLFQVMKASMGWDNVAREWATGMEISFEVGYPYLQRVYDETLDINIATVHTFLTILSLHPDTFIARKVGSRESTDIREAFRIGLSRAREVSRKAGEVLDLGGLFTVEGRRALRDMDAEMRSLGKDYNPGSTADLTASSLMIAILCGLRP